MRLTFLGHAGWYIETRAGSVLCDPWFTPAYFGAWFPFPRNDGLDPARFAKPDYLYVSHLHRDHFDPEWLRAHVDKRTRVLLPELGIGLLERELRALGFHDFVHTKHGERVELDGLGVTIFAYTQPSDGPLGDSAIVIDDGSARVLNQNDARPGDVDELKALGPFDAHLLQFSGGIWFPMVYDLPAAEKTSLARAKRIGGMDRARRYMDAVDARVVLPCAGPACFLDEPLFGMNDLDRDRASIFPDQAAFVEWLATQGNNRARLVVPGSVVDVDSRGCTVTHPVDDVALRAPFEDKRSYLERYRTDWRGWLERERASWSRAGKGRRRDLVAELAAWLEPLLARAPITSAGIGGNVVIDVGEEGAGVRIDFVKSAVRPWLGEPYVYKVDVDRRLIETLIDDRVEDWVNSLFLSCRFVAHRDGPFNEFVMTFFKCLSEERIAYLEKRLSESRAQSEEFFERDGWRIERWCPHQRADLTRFGEVKGGVLTCSLHRWRFDLASGRCLSRGDLQLRCARANRDSA